MKATNASTCTVDAHERVGDYVIILLVRSWYATLYKQRLSYMYTPFFKAAVRTYIGGEGGGGCVFTLLSQLVHMYFRQCTLTTNDVYTHVHTYLYTHTHTRHTLVWALVTIPLYLVFLLCNKAMSVLVLTEIAILTFAT